MVTNSSFENILANEILFQATAAISALEQSEVFAEQQIQLSEEHVVSENSPSPTAVGEQKVRAIYDAMNKRIACVSSFVINHANISKLIWLSDSDCQKLKASGLSEEEINEIIINLKNFRTKYGYDDDKSPFHYKDRDLRNNLEHFNTSLFHTLKRNEIVVSARTCHSSAYLNPVYSVSPKGQLRVFHSDTREFRFLDKTYNLTLMELDVRTIQERLTNAGWASSETIVKPL